MGEILELLDDERVFRVELSEDKSYLNIEEACDCYFFEDLKKEQVEKLIAELTEIKNQMI